MTADYDVQALTGALERLREELAATTFPLRTEGADDGERARAELAAQVDDYVLPRLRNLDAPLLMVVGGSTGAGKSTLVNSLVGAEVSAPGVLRPTTRSPVLACHPADVSWFEDDRILPGLARTSGTSQGTSGVHLAVTDRLPHGVALLDAPDIDSVVEANRTLAGQLLAAADAWLFVTTAARYADAVPWDLLDTARSRGTSLSLVLDRVPEGAAVDIAEHLRSMLEERGLGGTSVLVVPETVLEDGRLPAAALAPVRAWMDALAESVTSRGDVVARTLAGALASIPPRVEALAGAVQEQQNASDELTRAVDAAYARAVTEVDETIRSGALLRGEVLARWHDVVGTGDIMRALESRVSWMRDRIRSLVTGTPTAEVELRAAVETGVEAVVRTAAQHAVEQAVEDWRRSPAGRALLVEHAALASVSPDLPARTERSVHAWQAQVLELVRAEGMGKRSTARLASLGINGAGLAVMIAVFASTGGLTGAEVVVAGGTSALGQKVLEAVFGDQAVRALAEQARNRLLAQVRELLDEEARRLTDVVRAAAPRADAGGALDRALTDLRAAL